MIISILSSILIWGCTFIVFLRILSRSGIVFPQNKLTSVILSDKSLNGSHDASKKETAAVFLLAFLFRIIVFLLSLCIIYMFNDNIKSLDDILEQYMKWDANNYIRIATGGYKYFQTPEGDYSTIAFFPLYPWLIRCFNIIFRDLRVSGMLLSFILYAGSCGVLYRLFCIDYNKDTSIRAIIYLSVFPHALFFGTMMNESMLLFTSSVTLYYIRKHNWPLVGIWGAFAALSRMAGILLAFPAAVEWLEEYKIFEKLKNKDFKTVCNLFFTKGLWIFLMLSGTAVYLFCNYKTTGEWFKFLEYQDKIWYNGGCYFGSGIKLIFERAFSNDIDNKFSIWIPEMVSIIFVISMLLYGLRKNKNMYTAFLIIYIIINTGFKWPISVARYMTCAVPAFLFLSDFSERHKWTESFITASMAAGMGIYLVGYLTWKQIL